MQYQIEETYRPVDDGAPLAVVAARDDIVEGLADEFVAVGDGFQWLVGEPWDDLGRVETVTPVVWRFQARATAEVVGGRARDDGPVVTIDGTSYVFEVDGEAHFKRFIDWFEALTELGVIGSARIVE